MIETSFIKNVQKTSKPCIHPWFYLWINAAGDATVCPQNRTRLGSLKELSIDEIWNSPKIQNIRKNFLNEDYEQAGCEAECPYLRGSYQHAQEEIPVEELIFPDIELSPEKNTQASKNLNKAIEAYNNQEISLESNASVFDCQTILTCNSDCIMCGQPHESKLKHDSNIKEKILHYSKNLRAIRFQGGEVFIDKEFINNQKAIANHADENLQRTIITNGTLLNEEKIDTLLGLKGHTKFIVSMDGATKKTVDKIRYKLKYEKILSTIEYIARQQERLNKQHLIIWNYTVMYSNLQEVSSAIQMAKNLKIDINFAAIQGNYPEENFFRFPLVMQEEWNTLLNNWEEASQNSTITISGFEGLRKRAINPIN